ncbi:MAG: SH3 domain-containing protein [Lewinellaceae bacterium]|nr:SH3 domain-containing protein [Phaeodactylibacter sp.]MCB9350950.1 SH3 domain-containing protein [Lewinellaceae bacterium]
MAASALNLREQPHTNAAILAVAEYGEAINLLDKSPRETNGYSGEWVEVKYGPYPISSDI